MTQSMRIGELAAAAGLKPGTIRYYETIGLLPQPHRTPAGYRQYGPDDLTRLRFILRARTLGFSLDDIGTVLALVGQGACPCDHVRTRIDEKLSELDRHIASLRELRQSLLAIRSGGTPGSPAGGRICDLIEHHDPGIVATT